MTQAVSSSPPKWVAIRLSVFYGALFLVVGIVMPFWPVWLTARGLDATEIGTVLAVGLLTRVIASPLAAHFADLRGKRHQTMSFLAAGMVGAYLLYGLTWNFWTVLPVAMLSACFFPALMPLAESLTVRATYDQKLDYGRIRLWGSVAFILTAIAGGLFLEGKSVIFVWWMIIGAAIVVFLATFILPHDQQPKLTPAEGTHAWARAQQLVFQRRFLLFLLVAGLIQASHAVYYGFATLHWLSLGYSKTMIGVLWAEGVVAEILLFAVSNRVIARVGPERLLLIACALGVVRWLVTSEASSLAVLFAIQLLHAMTYAASHLAAMHIIQRTTPADLSATAQSVYASTSMGVFMGIAMFASGPLYAAIGGGAYYWMAGMAVVATVGAVFLLRNAPD
ncbi:MAG TPA: MFS transporter [Sneathiellales bacterium]|nr:MFS transporter [Sneathiellales bacterium]